MEQTPCEVGEKKRTLATYSEGDSEEGPGGSSLLKMIGRGVGGIPKGKFRGSVDRAYAKKKTGKKKAVRAVVWKNDQGDDYAARCSSGLEDFRRKSTI